MGSFHFVIKEVLGTRSEGLVFRASMQGNLQVLYIMMHSKMAVRNSWNIEIQMSTAGCKEFPSADYSQASFLKASSGHHAK